jgi:hypothetical protein
MTSFWDKVRYAQNSSVCPLFNCYTKFPLWGHTQVCKEVVETYHSQSVGRFSISRSRTSHQHWLHWVQEDAPNNSWTILSLVCKWKSNSIPTPVTQWNIIRITSADDHPQYGARCYVRLLFTNEPSSLTDVVLQQLTLCEHFCQDEVAWAKLYSAEAVRARDAELRGIK